MPVILLLILPILILLINTIILQYDRYCKQGSLDTMPLSVVLLEPACHSRTRSMSRIIHGGR